MLGGRGCCCTCTVASPVPVFTCAPKTFIMLSGVDGCDAAAFRASAGTCVTSNDFRVQQHELLQSTERSFVLSIAIGQHTAAVECLAGQR